MFVIESLFILTWYAVIAVIVAVIALMLVRLALNYADVNPFSRPVLMVRSLTDPFVSPVRRAIANFGFGPNVAPLVTILLAILLGWFALSLTASVLNTAAGVLRSAQQSQFIPLLGYVLYGLLAFYELLIFIRIIFSWGMVSEYNSIMRLLVRATDPLLVPLRRMIPPLGMFDISPIVAFVILWLFEGAIAGTLLRGLPLRFVG